MQPVVVARRCGSPDWWNWYSSNNTDEGKRIHSSRRRMKQFAFYFIFLQVSIVPIVPLLPPSVISIFYVAVRCGN